MPPKIVKKAWEVIDPTLYDGIYELEHGWQPVYAESAGKAKQKCSEKESYINVKCRRIRGCDIVLHSGTEIRREYLQQEIIKMERVNKISKFPDDELFYIQNGFVGNSILWWALQDRGYTSDIDRAQTYTKAEVLKYFLNNSDRQDKIWCASHVQQHIKKHVEHQYLDSQYKI